jgi:hypothetical protein
MMKCWKQSLSTRWLHFNHVILVSIREIQLVGVDLAIVVIKIDVGWCEISDTCDTTTEKMPASVEPEYHQQLQTLVTKYVVFLQLTHWLL